jgi:hypothetical protein
MAAVWQHCDELPVRQQRLLMMRFYGNMTRPRSARIWASPRCTSPGCWTGPWPTCARRSPTPRRRTQSRPDLPVIPGVRRRCPDSSRPLDAKSPGTSRCRVAGTAGYFTSPVLGRQVFTRRGSTSPPRARQGFQDSLAALALVDCWAVRALVTLLGDAAYPTLQAPRNRKLDLSPIPRQPG